MRNTIRKKIKETFFSSKKNDIVLDEFFNKDEYIEDESSTENYFTIAEKNILGTKLVFVFNDICSFVFIEKNNELIILMITGAGRINLNDASLIVATSTMKIDIISSSKWENENKELFDIVELISNNTSNIPKEVYNKGSKDIVGFKDEYMNSPILYFLSKDSVIRYRTRIGTKTKDRFLASTIKIILNILTKKESIFEKDISKIKEHFYKTMILKLSNKHTRMYFIEDLKERGLFVLINSMGEKLMTSVEYSTKDWNNYFDTEFKHSLVPELMEYLFDIIAKTDQDIEIKRAMNSIISQADPNNYSRYEQTAENRNKILESLMGYISTEMNFEILKNTTKPYSKEELPDLNISYSLKERQNDVVPF